MQRDDTVNLTTTELTPTSEPWNSTLNHTSFYTIYDLIKASQNQPLEFDELLKNIIIITCYSFIVIISLIGNCMVIKIILFGKQKMLTTTNILIASLAFSDIVMTSLNIPFNVARLLLDSWPFGQTLCVLVPFIQVSCVYVSTFTMTIIAYHRWKVLSRPILTSTSRKISNRHLILIILSTWL